jgi:hypothetical protein
VTKERLRNSDKDIDRRDLPGGGPATGFRGFTGRTCQGFSGFLARLALLDDGAKVVAVCFVAVAQAQTGAREARTGECPTSFAIQGTGARILSLPVYR